MGQGSWQPFIPLADLERVFEILYIPKVRFTWKAAAPQPRHAHVLMETTLEGLLAGYEGGIFAPRSREEMFRDPITRQMLRTDIPNRLGELGIDEVMVTTASSVADRSALDPKFNYLTYDVADVDWQLGHTWDFLQWIQRLYEQGLAVVPDLPFVHQVRRPFAGSLDQILNPEDQEPVYVDAEAAMFRDYGTWMFKLSDPWVRKQLVEKIVAFTVRYRLPILRLGYLDGLIYQYQLRETNYGEVLLQELRAALKAASPGTLILGETFAMQADPVIRECVDIFYAPYGFPILEEITKPPHLRPQSQVPDFDRLIPALHHAVTCSRRNAVYAQLHDEIYADPQVRVGRPETPWAYGKNPAELARFQGEAMIQAGWLPQEDLLDYVRRTVRNVEALTMFIANFMYMFVPGVDSLMLNCLEGAEDWKFHWDDVTEKQLAFWSTTGLTDRQTYLLHKQHRLDMARLRQIFRDYTLLDEDGRTPLTRIEIWHTNHEHGVLGLWRTQPTRPEHSHLVIFNLGPTAFRQDITGPYEIPLPPDCSETWEILFDGDWMDPLLRTRQRHYFLDVNEDAIGYAPGSLLKPHPGRIHPTEVLPLELGAHSLIVLKVS
jgi:1,4-alpha-glucan branching enzyme